jgi:hypothetical protein
MTVSKRVRKFAEAVLPDKLTAEGNLGPVKIGAEYDLQGRMRRERPSNPIAEHSNARRRRRTGVERMEMLP